MVDQLVWTEVQTPSFADRSNNLELLVATADAELNGILFQVSLSFPKLYREQ